MRYGIKALSATMVMFALAAPVTAQERQTMADFSYSDGVKDGACKIAVRARDGETWVDFGLDITAGLFFVDVVRSRWDIVDGKNTDAEDLLVTLTFQDGEKTTSLAGGYRDDNYQGVWSEWFNSEITAVPSQRATEKLLEASSVTVSFQGKQIAEANLGPTGFILSNLVRCAQAERAKRSN